MSEQNDEENKNAKQKDDIDNSFENKEKSKQNEENNLIFENELEKDDINFDSIDFNINPFNDDNPEKKKKDNDSDELVLEEKEDDKFDLNNIPLNTKYHTSNDLLKINIFSKDSQEEKELDKNKNILNNISNNNNNNNLNIIGNNINFLNYNSNNFISNDIYNNSRKSYNNTNNINYDLEANSFIPKNNNNNNFFSNKNRQYWICSFCHNLNYESKYYLFFIFYSWRDMQQMWLYK